MRSLLALCRAILWLFVTSTCAHALAWDAPTGGQPPTSYNVYRNIDGGMYTLLATVLVPTQSYLDSAPPPSAKWWCYQVTAVYGAGVGESAPGTIQGGSSTQLCFPPSPPLNLRKQ